MTVNAEIGSHVSPFCQRAHCWRSSADNLALRRVSERGSCQEVSTKGKYAGSIVYKSSVTSRLLDDVARASVRFRSAEESIAAYRPVGIRSGARTFPGLTSPRRHHRRDGPRPSGAAAAAAAAVSRRVCSWPAAVRPLARPQSFSPFFSTWFFFRFPHRSPFRGRGVARPGGHEGNQRERLLGVTVTGGELPSSRVFIPPALLPPWVIFREVARIPVFVPRRRRHREYFLLRVHLPPPSAA